MKSVMSHQFSRIPTTEIERSTFDRSHGCKTAFDSGYLVPFFLDEVLPGDEFKVDAMLHCQMLSPLVTNVMDNLFLETQWFFVPSRLVWTNFVKMMGERVNPRDSIDYLVPVINSGESGFAVGSLADYFGIPTGVPNLDVSALPFRCYAKIWDDWYRAEQLQDSIIQSSDDLGDGNPNSIEWNTLKRRGKRFDYFTACLPFPQLGQGVELPLGTSAPINVLNASQAWNGQNVLFSTPPGSNEAALLAKNGDVLTPIVNNVASLYADLSSATAATINTLRTAFQLQRLLERDARSGGMRYQEICLAHFKTLNPDARLQRSEYLGGSSQLIHIDQVLQTSATDVGASITITPQGNRVGIAQAITNPSWTKSFTEHGYIIGLVNVRADLNYQQGLNRLWSRRGRYDFYWPALAHLGEQAVLNKEIYAQGGSVVDSNSKVVDDNVFGYQERYAEYRYHPSLITGKLRSTASGSLDVWHLAQKFNALPTLSSEFIEDNPPLSRVLAVEGEPQFLLDSYIECICTRPLPLYGIPGLCDHF